MDFEELVDQLDAAVFSGDALEFPENLELLHYHLVRWGGEVLERIKDQKKEEHEPS